MSRLLQPSPAVVSAIETDVIDGGESGDEYQAIRDAWDGRRIAVPSDPIALRRSLIELSNAFDDFAEGKIQGATLEGRKFARAVVRGVETMMKKLEAVDDEAQLQPLSHGMHRG